MNKLVPLAAVVMLGLSTAAFAQNPAASMTTPPSQNSIQLPQSKAPAAHKMRTSHYRGAKKTVIAYHHNQHHKAAQARHHENGKKVAVKHEPASKGPKIKASS